MKHACAAAAVVLLLIPPADGKQTTHTPTRLVASSGDDRGPAWSPDGSRIAFESHRDGNWNLYVVDAWGRNLSRLTNDPGAERQPAWAPGGEGLAFARTDRSGHAISILSLADGSVRDVVRSAADPLLFPSWSPDGQRIAYTRQRGEEFRLEEATAKDGAVRDLLGALSSRRDLWPRFSHDGRLAFFSRRAPNLQHDDIYVVESSRMTRIPTGAGHEFCPAWSPDGRRLVFAQAEPPANRWLTIVELGGHTAERIALAFDAVTEPAWAPGGSVIAFAGRTGERYGIYTISLADRVRD